MNKGTTLVETIVYVGTIAVIFSAIVPFTIMVIDNGAKSATQQEVYGNARFIAEKIKAEIRRAKDIALVSPNSISLTNFAPDSTTVIDLADGNVRINRNGVEAVNLNSSGITVSDLTFTNNTSIDNTTKNISFTLTVSRLGMRQEYQGTVSLRSSAEIRSN